MTRIDFSTRHITRELLLSARFLKGTEVFLQIRFCGMPRFFCDYCDAYLTHDSAPGRQQHIRGQLFESQSDHWFNFVFYARNLREILFICHDRLEAQRKFQSILSNLCSRMGDRAAGEGEAKADADDAAANTRRRYGNGHAST